jgi:hypothetical protein
MSYTLIERKELTSAASSLSFENIPQIYDDLIIKASARCTRTDFALGSLQVQLNSVSSGYSNVWLRRNESGDVVSSSGNTGGSFFLNLYTVPGPTVTANTFGNIEFYIPNYRSSNAKLASSDGVGENNSSLNLSMVIMSHLSGVTNPVTSIQLSTSNDFVAGSSFSLYGINRQQAIGAPKAVGGAISFANGYWVHTFTGSGTFSPITNLSNVEYLVVAGGGGGGSDGGGGGAGGYLTGSLSSVSSACTVIVGAGGLGSNYPSPSLPKFRGYQGSNSIFSTITSTGGGGGGATGWVSPDTDLNGGPGGSGGGGSNYGDGLGGAASPSGQGNAGGAATGSAPYYPSGSGGGAGAAGLKPSSGSVVVAGGNGLSSAISGTSIFYAGGGGGSANRGIAGGAGGVGGGGAGGGGGDGSNGSVGLPGTEGLGGGGGGGGARANGGNGGSGIVIVRYKAQ